MVEYWYHKDAFEKNLICNQHFDEIPSTQVYARELAEKYASGASPFPLGAWQVVTSDLQTAGIAQRGRTWSSPGAVNLYASYLIPFPLHKMPILFNISQVTTIAVARVLEQLGLKPQIKWVNDLLCNSKKVCGVLCENRGVITSSPETLMLLIGIGLNVNMTHEDCQGLGQEVSSLYLETGHTYDRKRVMEMLNVSLFETLQTFILQGLQPLIPYLREHMIHLGKRIVVEDNGQEFEGLFENITPQGCMLLNVDGQTQERVTGRIVSVL